MFEIQPPTAKSRMAIQMNDQFLSKKITPSPQSQQEEAPESQDELEESNPTASHPEWQTGAWW